MISCSRCVLLFATLQTVACRFSDHRILQARILEWVAMLINSYVPINKTNGKNWINSEKHPNFLRLNKEEIEYLNRLINRIKIEMVVKILSKNRSPGLGRFTDAVLCLVT